MRQAAFGRLVASCFRPLADGLHTDMMDASRHRLRSSRTSDRTCEPASPPRKCVRTKTASVGVAACGVRVRLDWSEKTGRRAGRARRGSITSSLRTARAQLKGSCV